ncbi:MAG: sulfite exporter TauE/SafE family protein [Rubrobacteraceae bacterium]
MPVLGLLLAVLMGLTLGLLGGGGSVLAVPILKYVMGFGAKEAIAASLAVVGVTSLSGAAGHWREGNVRLHAVLFFGLSAAAGAYVGAKYLADFFSGAAQLLLFGVVMLAAAFFMFRENGSEKEQDEPEDGITAKTALLLIGPGAGVGVLTGLVGVGGGFLIVPALALLVRLPMKAAVGTSLAVISLNSASGFAGYLGQVNLPWTLVILFIALAIAGTFTGTYLTRFVPQSTLKRLFAVFLIAMAVFIIYQNRGAVPLP